MKMMKDYQERLPCDNIIILSNKSNNNYIKKSMSKACIPGIILFWLTTTADADHWSIERFYPNFTDTCYFLCGNVEMCRNPKTLSRSIF